MRETALLVGEPTTSKTWSLINLAILYPEKKVCIFDPDRGVPKVLVELGGQEAIPNLEVIRVRKWEPFIEDFKRVHNSYGEEDWVCFDMMGRFWDLAQVFFSQFVFGDNPIDHLLQARKQVGRPQFGGFDGLADWAVIKRLHNFDFIDSAILDGEYNIMATTSLRGVLPIEREAKAGSLESVYQRVFGFHPEGEKHNIHRFEIQVYVYRKADNKFYFRFIRDKGRPTDMMQELLIEGSFWQTYAKVRGL